MSGFDEDAIEAARKTFAGPVTFLKSAPESGPRLLDLLRAV